MAKIASFRSAVSDLMSRVNFARRAGLSFDGKRDLYEVLGYPRFLSAEDYWDRYRRGGISKRIVEAKPEATWRGGAELIEVENEKRTTRFEGAFEELNERLYIWATCKRTDVLAGIGRYAIILIGAPGELEEPLEPLRSPDNLAYLTPYSELDATFDPKLDVTTDSSSVRYGLPEFYRMKRLASSGVGARERRVHWTRVVHVADGVLDDRVYGIPRLEAPWNDLLNLEKVTGGGSEAFWLQARQGVQFDLDPDVTLSAEGEKKMADEVEEYVHQIRRFVRTKGVKMKVFGSDVADFLNPVKALLELISATTGIPQRILMGSERGELASTQDRSNWNDTIGDRRSQFAEPFAAKLLVNRLIELRVLPKPKRYNVRWPEMKNMTEAERADITVKMTRANQQQGENILTTAEIRGRVWGLEPNEETDAEDEDGERVPAPEEEDEARREAPAARVRTAS